MRSIIVPAVVGAFSSVVCYGLLKCPFIRRPMIERKEKRDLEEDNKQFSDTKVDAAGLEREENRDLEEDNKQFSDAKVDAAGLEREENRDLEEDNKQFSDTKVDAAGLEREENRDLEEDNKDDIFDAEAYVEGLLASTSDDKQSTESAEDCYAVLNVLRKLHDQNPTDVQILKTLAVVLFSLAYIPCLDVDYEQDEEWLRESKLLLEEALKIDKNDDSVKFELGRAHYYIMESDYFVNQDSDLFMEHAISAYGYFKEVEDKGPEVYKFHMLDVLRKFMGRSMSNLEEIYRDRKASSSALYHVNAEQTEKEYGDPSNIPSADVVCG